MRKATGTELMQAIVRSKFLPDHPTPFRRSMVTKAMEQEGLKVSSPSLLGEVMKRLLMQGYLLRTEDVQDTGERGRFHLWMFARPDRTSTRPGWRPGEKNDLWRG